MEKVEWKVEGMTCSNCALTVSKYLEKKGMEKVFVNPVTGEVTFNYENGVSLDNLRSGIRGLGYQVSEEIPEHTPSTFLKDHKSRFLFTLPFTVVLMLHMLDPWIQFHWLMNPWVQLSLCLPVFITGMWFFGKSAVKSIINGVPNMDVLISIGAIASFSYSLTGAINQLGHSYLFFETTASIITLVFLGNYLEHAAISSTQRAVRSLAKTQDVKAFMIAFDGDHQEQVFEVKPSSLRIGDLILIKTGEQVPIDCRVIWGEGEADESILTGESATVRKSKKDFLIGGSILHSGIIKAQVTATGKDTVISGILKMVSEAQAEKPPMQKLANKISAVFVPLVILISIGTFFINYYTGISFSDSLMRSVAVLVISCPCAMGIATPAAIAVGLGRAAKKGILFRNALALDSFQKISLVVFDKTGTLTTGKFNISSYQANIDDDEFKRIVYSLEKFSNHPIARSISELWKTADPIRWKEITEEKGIGIRGIDNHDNIFIAGSFRVLPKGTENSGHDIYIIKNGNLLGFLDLEDEIRPEARQVVQYLHSKKIKTMLLSGDRKEKADIVAGKVGISEILSEQSPADKMNVIALLNRDEPVAMVGDGINDAPALAKATLGISLGEASQIALHTSDIILMNSGLKNLPEALGLGKHTNLTIKQNLGWAFAYNIISIPIAAIGLLTPTFSALSMGLSDVVLAINSVRLFVKKVS